MSDEGIIDNEMPIGDLSHKATVARQADVRDEIRRITSKEEIRPEDDVYLEELSRDFDELDSHRKGLERKALMARVDVATGKGLKAESGAPAPKTADGDFLREPRSVNDAPLFDNPWDLDEMRRFSSPEKQGQELRARATDAAERMYGTSDSVRATVTRMIEEDHSDNAGVAEFVLKTSAPAYTRAFSKFISNGGHGNYTDEEAKAVQRAMTLTTTAGGFLLPTQLDPTVIITSDGTYNEVRKFARNVVATSNIWYGVSSPYASWSVDGEATAVSDDATTFAQPSVTIYKVAGFIPISVEALQDEQNVASEIGRLLAMGKDNFESNLFTLGTGSSQHTGIAHVTAGVASNAGSIVPSATSDVFAIADVYAVDGDLPARYRQNSGWLMHRGTANAIRQFDTAGGSHLWARIGEGQPDTLLGNPVFESESMDGAVTAGADNDLLIYGDRDAFVVADRLGMVVEPIQHLFQQTTAGTGFGTPTGQRGFYAYARSGSNLVNAAGLRLGRVT